jgi:murein DD-endopeptidase MepM/ murein hydrolase activator NlpD
MRLATVTSAFALALLLPPGAAGFVADAPLPRPEPAPEWVHPVASDQIGYGESAARFGGPRGGRSHEGQDVFAPAGTPLVAVGDGVVVEHGSGDGRGHYIAIYSRAADRTFLYYHLLAPARVRTGERVTAGQKVGLVGCSGSCWGDHLHFEIRRGRGIDGPPSDPLPQLLRWPRAT